ncbi:maker661 [Drosophila busckii]|uniref:Maker661 n=1 Tax=Drosophila busckii TaxID=30019 RepID=A0A0M3QW10_DROBS|nr:maker661 [Drosophila busckii]
MLSTTTATTTQRFGRPEVAIDQRRFPLQHPKTLHNSCYTQQQQQQHYAQQQQPKFCFIATGKFPLQTTTTTAHKFPLQQQQFPVRQQQLLLPQQFPLLCQLKRKNVKQAISNASTKCLAQQELQEFPTIKSQLVGFSKVATTVTHKTELELTTDDDAAAAAAAVVVDDHDNVAIVAYDNELNALNLNVAGVGELKEIEHQQAENFNDAFGRRHDAMNVAKNKRKFGEQSKLAATFTHNELNMTKEQQRPQQLQLQSICLASEQSQTIEELYTDARETSSEQVDGQQLEQLEQQQQIDYSLPYGLIPANVHVTLNEAASRPGIELLKCALSVVLLDASQLDLIDLLLELVQLIATPAATSTGNYWSVPVTQRAVSECVDMTISKVSDESEATANSVAEVLSEQIEEQQQTADDNSSSSNNNSEEMKYDLLKSSAHLTEALPRRLSNSTAATVVAPVAATLAPTSRIRDMPSALLTETLPRRLSNSTATATVVAPVSATLAPTSRIRDVITPSALLTETLPRRLSNTTATVAPVTANTTPTSRIRDLHTSSALLNETLPKRLSSSTAYVAPVSATIAALPATTTSRIRDAPLSSSRPLLGELKRSSTSREDVSIDVDSLLPERTRLRRQRRMRSQESVEETPEEVLARLNKLKERITASLSEVKNVIKQYSTDSEVEGATNATAEQTEEAKPAAAAAAPVTFRFVKKVRRRSYFDEAEEERAKEEEQAKEQEQAAATTPDADIKKETNQAQIETKTEVQAQAANATAASKPEQQQPEKLQQAETKQPIKTLENIAEAATVAEKQPQAVELQQQSVKEAQAKQEQPAIATLQPKQQQSAIKTEKDKVQAKLEFLAKVQSELKSKKEAKTPAINEPLQQQQQQQPVEGLEATTTTAALPNESAKQTETATAESEDSKPKKTSGSKKKEPINQSIAAPGASEQTATTTTTTQQVAVAGVADIEAPPIASVAATPQIATTLNEKSTPQQQQSEQQQLVVATKDSDASTAENSLNAMPELKVLTGPVQPVKIETVEQQQPHDESGLSVKKKTTTHLKKLVRKNSIDKGKEKVPLVKSKDEVDEGIKLNNILRDKNKISNLTDRINKLTPPKKQIQKAKEPTAPAAATVAAPEPEQQAEQQPDEPLVIEPAVEEALPAPKKPRQIKKKVIIKRQKRKLSIGDTFFIQQEVEEPKVPEIETIEKTIAYVTDDEAESEPEPEPEPPMLKSCLHVREYKVGDLVLYAERYRKTQVRWKRGRVLERITSISYLLDIEGKEVAAHISYMKKNTGRKVKFVGKEYLEIDYEQVVEEERRARSYSIWNMV